MIKNTLVAFSVGGRRTVAAGRWRGRSEQGEVRGELQYRGAEGHALSANNHSYIPSKGPQGIDGIKLNAEKIVFPPLVVAGSHLQVFINFRFAALFAAVVAAPRRFPQTAVNNDSQRRRRRDRVLRTRTSQVATSRDPARNRTTRGRIKRGWPKQTSSMIPFTRPWY